MSRFNQPSSSRDALFGGGGGGGGGAAGYTPINQKLVSWDDDDEDGEEEEEIYSSPLRKGGGGNNYDSVQQIREQQYNLIQEQDKGLEALSEVISRQKNLAQVIGNEVEYQNELIDDITDHVDRTRDRLVGQTGSIRTIDRKDSTGRYWAIIILLLVAIIIITLV